MTLNERMNSRQLATISAMMIVGLVLATTAVAEPRPSDRETREFKVLLDGKERGKCSMQVDRRDDGAETMHINARLNINFVVYEYRYSSVGTEVWKDDRLIEMENTSDFNGTKYVVKANSTKRGLHVTVNGKTSPADPQAWATSYWRLPQHVQMHDQTEEKGIIPAGGGRRASKPVVRAVSLLDSDKGQKLRGDVQRVGEEYLTVAGKKKPCLHYKIGGDVKVEVWYDSDLRLVRQETVESGHKTVLELTRISGE